VLREEKENKKKQWTYQGNLLVLLSYSQSQSKHQYFLIDTKFTQQRLKDLKPNCNINVLLAAYFIAAIVFIPLGSVFNSNSRSVVQEYEIKYDGDSPDVTGCSISESNTAKTCEVFFIVFYTLDMHDSSYLPKVNFLFDDDISGPIYVYYSINHFYQNHRRYVRSRSPDQLMGEVNFLLYL